jgi:hypothetical protein
MEIKYLDQLKRSRELTVKLESEKAKASKLQARVIALEKEKMELQTMKQSPVALPSQKCISTPLAQLDETASSEGLAERLERVQKALTYQKKVNDDVKRDNLRMRKALLLELGDETQVDNALKSCMDSPSRTETAPVASGWKGRAQQITLLKGRIKDLERHLHQLQDHSGDHVAVSPVESENQMTHSIVSKDVDTISRSVVEQRQKNRQIQIRDIQQALDQRESDLAKERARFDGCQARLRNLERENAQLRQNIQALLEKSEGDDQLLEAYRQELEEKRREVRRAATANPSMHRNQEQSQLEQEIHHLKDTIVELRRQMQRGAAIPAWLEDSSPSDTELMVFVRDQRRAILALESELHKRDQITTAQFSSSDGCDAILREENIALKYRIKTLSEMTEREINLHEALAAQKAAAAIEAANAVRVAESRPSSSSAPIAGRRASESKGLGAAPEYEALRQQYDDLKRAYNALQSKSVK